MTKTYKEEHGDGHFYSALPSYDDINEFYSKDIETELCGININRDNQFALLEDLVKFYPPPFSDTKHEPYRYYYKNGAYSYTDGIILYSMIRNFEPRRIIEIGSGFSSAVMLDVNEHYFDNNIDLTFIDPYTARLKLVTSQAERKSTVKEERLQDIDLSIFDALAADDILFIDSTHVSKVNSDVNKIMFEILPRLNPGVIIHFHDIFWPFIYPKPWLEKGRAWNESYLLRAFLQFNDSFEIILFGDYIHKTSDWFKENMPLSLKITGGNIWLRKIK